MVPTVVQDNGLPANGQQKSGGKRLLHPSPLPQSSWSE
jgi:hypothetical protein